MPTCFQKKTAVWRFWPLDIAPLIMLFKSKISLLSRHLTNLWKLIRQVVELYLLYQFHLSMNHTIRLLYLMGCRICYQIVVLLSFVMISRFIQLALDQLKKWIFLFNKENLPEEAKLHDQYSAVNLEEFAKVCESLFIF